MAEKLTRLTHKIAKQLHVVAKSCTICSSLSRRPVRKLLDTPSYALVISPMRATRPANLILLEYVRTGGEYTETRWRVSGFIFLFCACAAASIF
jgi:hypothetical protein